MADTGADQRPFEIAGSWIEEVFSRSTLGIVQADANGRIVYANVKARQISGYLDLVGKRPSDLFNDPESRRLIEERLEARRRGLSEEYEIEITHGTHGRKVPICISAMPIFSEANEFLGAVIIVRNRELEAVKADLNAEINSAGSSDALLKCISKCLRTYLPFDLVRVTLYSQDAQHARIMFQDPPESDPAEARWIPIRKSMRRMIEKIKPDRLHLPDFREEPGVEPLLNMGIKWSMRFPARREGHTAGAISVLTRNEEGFTDQEFELFSSLPLDNALAAVVFFESRQELQFTLSMAKAIAQCSSEVEIFNLLARELVVHYGWSHASVFWPDLINRKIVLQSQAGIPNYVLPQDYKLNLQEGLLGYVFERGEDVCVPDVAADERFRSIVIKDYGGEKSQSVLCMPIRAHGRIYALLNVEDTRTNAFSSEEREQLRRMLDELGEIVLQRQQDSLVVAAFKATPTVILLIDDQGLIRDSNPAACELFGLTAEQLRGESIDRFFLPQEGRTGSLKDIRSDAEIEVRTSHGQPVKGIMATLPLQGTLNLSMLAFRDTTVQKRAQELDALTGVYADLARQIKPDLAIIGACVQDIGAQASSAAGQRIKALIGRGSDIPELVDSTLRNLRQVESKFDKVLLLGSSHGLRDPDPITIYLPAFIDNALDEMPRSVSEVVDLGEIPKSYVKADPAQLAVVFQTLLGYFLRVRRPRDRIWCEITSSGTAVAIVVRGFFPPRLTKPVQTPANARESLDVSRTVQDIHLGRPYLKRIIEKHQGTFPEPEYKGDNMVMQFILPAWEGQTA